LQNRKNIKQKNHMQRSDADRTKCNGLMEPAHTPVMSATGLVGVDWVSFPLLCGGACCNGFCKVNWFLGENFNPTRWTDGDDIFDAVSFLEVLS
jgi:hypothetical protein